MLHGRELLRLERQLYQLFEPALRDHCRVANLRDSQLIMIADSPTWATKLRYQLPALLADLRRMEPATSLRGFAVKVSPFAVAREVRPASHQVISESTVALLSEVANTLREPQLKAALLRLARRHTKHGPE